MFLMKGWLNTYQKCFGCLKFRKKTAIKLKLGGIFVILTDWHLQQRRYYALANHLRTTIRPVKTDQSDRISRLIAVVGGAS
jgi:hypothetical protein